jgi:heme exporter protein A
MRLSAGGLAAVRGERRVFEDVSFTLSAGEALAVTGPNGAGKSTLLRIVAGLLEPTAGHLDLTPASDAPRAGRLHYLGHLDALKPALTVGQNLQYWRRLWGGAGVEAALAAVDLADLADLPAAVLSAGQRRRVAIARLLLAERPLWLLDEPATGLDGTAEANLGRLLAAHLAAGGLAMVATHRDLPVAPAATIALGAA